MISPFTLARIDHRLRGFIASTLPPSLYTKLYSASRSWYLDLLAKETIEPVKADYHPTTALGLQFRNDLGNAAGLDKNGELLPFNYSMGAGFAIVGTVLNKPHTGNLIPSLPFFPDANPWAPLPHSQSCLNSMGLPSKGYLPALDNIKRFRDSYNPVNFPIGISVMGHPLQEGQQKIDGVCEVIEAVSAEVDFIEINESCPNVTHHDTEGLEKRIASFDQARKNAPKHVALVVKVGAIPDAKGLVSVLDTHSIEGLCALNTQTNYDYLAEDLDPRDKKLFDYYTQNHKGGMSGALIRQTSLEQLSAVSKVITDLESRLTLIHVGGIQNHEDVLESRLIAPLREWYTGYMDCMGHMRPRAIYETLTQG